MFVSYAKRENILILVAQFARLAPLAITPLMEVTVNGVAPSMIIP